MTSLRELNDQLRSMLDVAIFSIGNEFETDNSQALASAEDLIMSCGFFLNRITHARAHDAVVKTGITDLQITRLEYLRVDADGCEHTVVLWHYPSDEPAATYQALYYRSPIDGSWMRFGPALTADAARDSFVRMRIERACAKQFPDVEEFKWRVVHK